MIQPFDEKYRLRFSRDDCGDVIIRSKRGHLYVDDDSILGLM